MSLLLDTHIWLWSLFEPERLAPRVKRALLGKDELWLSSISVWEALVLAEEGRLTLEGDPGEWIQDALGTAPLREAPITHEIARESRRIPLAHGDPADRFLAATARVLGLKLVTADRRLVESRELSVLPNR